MFGYVNINQDKLSENEIARFKEVYCGVCRALRLGDGHMCHLALSYDFAFLGLLLNALYEPEKEKGAKRGEPHPKKKQPYAISKLLIATLYLPREICSSMNFLVIFSGCSDAVLSMDNTS